MLGQTQGTATTGTLSFNTAATQASNVATYAITGLGLTANNGNYNFVQAAGNATALNITPATLTYTANAVSQSYGTAIPSLSGAVSGFVLGQTRGGDHRQLSFNTAATQASNVATYAITGLGLTANNGNYNFVQAAGNATALNITPATLTYTANAVSQSYRHGDPQPQRRGERVRARTDPGHGDDRHAEFQHGGDAVEQCRELRDQRLRADGE